MFLSNKYAHTESYIIILDLRLQDLYGCVGVPVEMDTQASIHDAHDNCIAPVPALIVMSHVLHPVPQAVM